VTGLDLVAWQIRVAAGERLPPAVLERVPRGHALEARIYAEDPHRDFAPVAGAVTAWRMPGGPGVRLDAGVAADTPLPVEYDPLLAKLLVHADDRPAAVARLRRALDETMVGGVQTDLSFLRWLVDDPGFVAGAYDTALVEARWAGGPELSAEERGMAARVALEARLGAATARPPDRPLPTPGVNRWAERARREAVSRGRSR
jgi:acetyl-CoA/propionyl-CoA carboxylase biotin carboxyl carrier protein